MDNGLYTAFKNLLNWIYDSIIAPIGTALNETGYINDILKVVENILNRLLGIFNGKITSDVTLLTTRNVAIIIGIVIMIIALSLIIKVIRTVLNNIMQWISGDTIIITNVRERRKNKKASKR